MFVYQFFFFFGELGSHSEVIAMICNIFQVSILNLHIFSGVNNFSNEVLPYAFWYNLRISC